MNSANGFQTQVWGTPGWVFLHSIAFNFPLVATKRQKIYYIQFLKAWDTCCRVNIVESVIQKQFQMDL